MGYRTLYARTLSRVRRRVLSRPMRRVEKERERKRERKIRRTTCTHTSVYVLFANTGPNTDVPVTPT